ncbi:hypothetical protein SteCoe_6191 [Stentor coeruleus]|uniref:Phospholipid-transporting ATPase n=1 Tax=Stentor coeruleus TaxID=5963 RepID=A0A1R2CQL8_9CILI|nr:hypothetical protein SteCoe_6191 [Stentor coeruleus]
MDNKTTENIQIETEESSFRRVILGQVNIKEFCSNQVVTSRYSLINWIPKSIILQFARVSNIYFLAITILVFFPFSPRLPWGLASTFLGVIAFTMIKEGVEDISRHKQDREVNKAKVTIYDLYEKKFIEIESKDLRVGNIVKIKENENIHADLIMLCSSSAKGVAYVNTMNLDGETNLKEKIISHLTEKIKDENDLNDFKAEFDVDHPNSSLVKWNCNMIHGRNFEPMSLKQLLMRGCVLKNTDWVLGVVIYSGVDCKIVQNSKKVPTKVSVLQKELNKVVYSIIVFLFVLCLLLGGFGKYWHDRNDSASEYIDFPDSYKASDVIVRAITFWIQLVAFIPISLYVVVETQRLILCSFIKNDILMYDEKLDRSASWRASDIIEQLGQVEFIFSDKTGTLTKNEMELLKCGINTNVISLHNDAHIEKIKKTLNKQKGRRKKEAVNYFRTLALCHSVFPTLHNEKLVYHSPSPDEIALVDGAKLVGFELRERREDCIVISVNGNEEVWKIIAEIPFSSERKRMSIILQAEDEKFYLFTKGADTIMLDLVNIENPEPIAKELETFALEGLRTLVMAGKELNLEEFASWNEEWKKVMLSNAKNKDEMIDEVCKKIEKDLTFYGTSAIEDKLQDYVPETIKLLIEAKIRLWVLTGDKEETAIEIAKSCNLINDQTELIKLFETSQNEINNRLQSLENKFSLLEKSFTDLEKIKNSLATPLSIAINGSTLAFIKGNQKLMSIFFRLGFIASTCICCRMSPSQKSDVVQLCKSNGKWISLAIGDGANDVSMIQTASIGVGVAGKEGTQAVLAAEFSITQFSHLRRLLFVHGRYAYHRMTHFILYFFYKNFVMEICEAWYSVVSGFSGQIYYLDWFTAFFNLFWTSWPSIAFFALEQDVPPEVSLKYPSLYSAGQKNVYFDLKTFWVWIGYALMSGTFIFWFPMSTIPGGEGKNGHEPGLFWISTVSFILMMHVVNTKLLIVSCFWNKINVGAICLSFLLFYVMIILLNTNEIAFAFQPEFPGLLFIILSHGKTWIIVILGSMIALMPDFITMCIKRVMFPTPNDKVRGYNKFTSKVDPMT